MNKNNIPSSIDGVSPLKKVAAIHDLSCFGRCALTVICPALSAMGTQVVPLPTCLLSSHTGGFTDMYFRDLTDAMVETADHFDRLDLRFDAIYTGFLGSAEQIALVKRFVEKFSQKDTLVFIDPVMGDGGELYSTYTEELMNGMSELCHNAHVITPNLTEACFLTGVEYKNTASMSEDELDSYIGLLAKKLACTGAQKTVITGIHKGEDTLRVCGIDNVTGRLFGYDVDRIHKNYPGTGDLFACVLLGSLLRGDGFERSIKFAADYTRDVMEYSSRFPTPEREGVAFEGMLGRLCEK